MPSENKPSISEVAAPQPSWIKPIRDDAFPAISGNGSIAPVVAAYTITEWANVSFATNYMWKRSSDSSLEFEDFIGGVTMGFNYAF